MNDLATRLRGIKVSVVHANRVVLGTKPLTAANEIIKEAADHIEAQEKLICDLSDCLEDMTKHYVEVRNDLYGFEATEEIEVIGAGKLIALSKSNPNTPERNDE